MAKYDTFMKKFTKYQRKPWKKIIKKKTKAVRYLDSKVSTTESATFFNPASGNCANNSWAPRGLGLLQFTNGIPGDAVVFQYAFWELGIGILTTFIHICCNMGISMQLLLCIPTGNQWKNSYLQQHPGLLVSFSCRTMGGRGRLRRWKTGIPRHS